MTLYGIKSNKSIIFEKHLLVDPFFNQFLDQFLILEMRLYGFS